MLTADVRPGQLEVLPDEIHERTPRLDETFLLEAIDPYPDGTTIPHDRSTARDAASERARRWLRTSTSPTNSESDPTASSVLVAG
jgi:hypothetical protein